LALVCAELASKENKMLPKCLMRRGSDLNFLMGFLEEFQSQKIRTILIRSDFPPSEAMGNQRGFNGISEAR
jgi:hypothetical protein